MVGERHFPPCAYAIAANWEHLPLVISVPNNLPFESDLCYLFQLGLLVVLAVSGDGAEKPDLLLGYYSYLLLLCYYDYFCPALPPY